MKFLHFIIAIILFQSLNANSLEEASNYLDFWEKVELDAFNYYYNVIPNLINKYQLKTACEVGVSCGHHSENILKTSRLEKLYSIDPYVVYGDETNPAIATQYVADQLFSRVQNRLSKFGNRSEIVRDFSINAAKRFDKSSIDLVFIDANHTYQYVKEDLEIWFEIIKPGGIISGDDYNTWPDVRKAVDEFFSAKKILVNVEANGRIWYAIKPL